MDILFDVISSMDRHAAKQFKVFASRASNLPDRKDFALYDAVRKQEGKMSEDELIEKLYVDNRNAYYRLKNRLLRDVSLSIFLHRHEENSNMYAHYLVAMGYYFSDNNLYSAANYFFKKAEGVAKSTELYSVLDVIYSRLIKLARELNEVNPENLIKMRKDNRALLNRIADTEDLLEVLEYRVKWNQNLIKPDADIHSLLKDTLEEYMVDPALQKSARFQLGVYFIISRDLLRKNDFEKLETYLKETLERFTKQGFFNKNNHRHKLQMIAWLANAAFKNKNFEASLIYADELEKEMQKYENLHYAAFEFFYYNIRVVNYSVTNPKKAIELLESLTHSERMLSDYGIFILFNLALLYYQERSLKKAIFYLNKLYLHDGYEKMDISTRLNASIGELLIRFDMGDYDVVDYRFKQIGKDFEDYLQQEEAGRESEFLRLFKDLSNNPASLRKKHFREKSEAFLQANATYWTEDASLFAYDKWLKKLIEFTH